jgi:hypothetical protein
MNTEFDQIAAAVSAASSWDRFPLDAGDALVREYAAYQTNHQRPKASVMSESISVTKLVLQGVQACGLASQVLRINWTNPNAHDSRVAVAMAEAVLLSWGIELTSPPVYDEATPESGAPDAQLVWPPVTAEGRPLRTNLSDVYKENYYHVREEILVDNADKLSGVRVQTDHRLVLLDSYWHEEALQWRLKLSNVSVPMEIFWIDHCKVRVGDEIIPKDPTP